MTEMKSSGRLEMADESWQARVSPCLEGKAEKYNVHFEVDSKEIWIHC